MCVRVCVFAWHRCCDEHHGGPHDFFPGVEAHYLKNLRLFRAWGIVVGVRYHTQFRV